MAVPKRKTSKAKRDKRRSHYWKMASPVISSCPQCGKPTRAYHLCTFCGFYQGVQVLPVKQREEDAAA